VGVASEAVRPDCYQRCYQPRGVGRVNVLVIFGAGASNDAANKWSNCQWPPPLTNALFRTDERPDEREFLASAPEASGLFDYLRRRLSAEGGNLEALLREVADVAERDQALAVGLLAVRFYLREYLWRCGQNVLNADANMTNYTTLVHALARWQARTRGSEVAFVTFNYDFLIERALEYEWAWSFHDINAYVQASRMLIKPHGSVDWGHLLVNDEATERLTDARSMMRAAPQIKYANTFAKLGSPDVIRLDTRLYAPALAIPMDRKSEYECPKEHLDALTEYLPAVESVLMIGWKAGDLDFVNLLAQYLSPTVSIQVVTKTDEGSRSVVMRLSDAGVKGTKGAVSGGFRAWLDGGLGSFIASIDRPNDG
jgi:hypothetical protein